MSAINHSEHPIFAARDAEFHDILLKPLRFGCKTQSQTFSNGLIDVLLQGPLLI
ncbi:hypothetical protein AGABI1DRAFT_86761 [Agaricus bisporus var. burnettii JB137-S8]|uniref:Uncharacterized protein n=1 Tax=Agaricus bisporus var. burnettii (strain JB137-S8 / ATCC MYA-4627 / FGSC 10392) TaxID=597362 RepID=K5X239_AGABU|nr:hypothetical protein AGABI2DRAFT_139602 [Agaricus bisporus var. bisporus H97]XP_007332192.1 uncharacterized protein AGABI1DRAFT_86761 [Agaricus bisporus var. burnettii JB137-S8]EKM77203.1 hypothetical protein AGABI1DRAFT_86761 [Agaricus bisporus var. burnettii JB137-S8]EKV42224.1 hypothetical protein AGABI2DRAFT_139602 [Agaricus bisporus var. bisporus H97]